MCRYEPLSPPPPLPPPLPHCWSCNTSWTLEASFVVAATVEGVNATAVADVFARAASVDAHPVDSKDVTVALSVPRR